MINAVIRREYGIDPDSLKEEKWLRLYAEYAYLKKQELENQEVVIHNAIVKVFNKLFPDGICNNTMGS